MVRPWWQAGSRSLSFVLTMNLDQLLARMKYGATIWNAWRHDHHQESIVLDGADLSGMILTGIDFSRVSLRGARLHATNLMNADLRRADFTGADLTEADLIAAKLQGAILTGATLREADLLGADLTGAIYAPADLIGALHPPVVQGSAEHVELAIARADIDAPASNHWRGIDARAGGERPRGLARLHVDRVHVLVAAAEDDAASSQGR